MEDYKIIVNKGITGTACEPNNICTFFNDDAKPIAVIKLDGTVELLEEGADKKAAKVFWNEIQVQGKSLITRITELEQECKSLEAENEMLKGQLEEHC